MHPDAPALLWDALGAARQTQVFLAGLSLDAYRDDALRKSAIERQLEILGEALGKLRKSDPETAATVRDIHRIVGLRNVLAHAYAVVDDAIVWTAVTGYVPLVIDDLTVLLGAAEDQHRS